MPFRDKYCESSASVNLESEDAVRPMTYDVRPEIRACSWLRSQGVDSHVYDFIQTL